MKVGENRVQGQVCNIQMVVRDNGNFPTKIIICSFTYTDNLIIAILDKSLENSTFQVLNILLTKGNLSNITVPLETKSSRRAFS